MAHENSVVIISSSPEFPSICDLLPKAVKKHQLRSGSNATPIPHDAPVAFTSAASLLQSSRISQSESTAMHESPLSLGAEAVEQFGVSKIASPPPPAAEHTNPVSRKGKENPKITVNAKKRGKTDIAECQKAAAEPRTAASTEAGHPKKQARKSRSRPDTAMAQTTLQKGKVTKVTAKEKQPIKNTETVSQHFAPQGPAPMPPSEPIPNRIEESFVSEPALKRRLDWTPPRDSVPIVCLSDTSTTKDSPSAAPAQNDVFKTLHETYGLAADPNAGLKGTLSFPDTEVLGKRKLIEMASKGNKQTSPTASPTKPKAAKKKPRTITDLATAAYRQSDDEEIISKSPRTGPLLDYLGKPSEQVAVTAKGTSAKPKERRVIKSKAGKKKEQPHKPILLSPTSAMRQVAKQDFVFGTASQLATEDDPVLLRALHEAMKLSNQADNDTLASSSSVNSKLAIREKKTKAGLWAASARYENGDLLDMDVLDLTCPSPLPLDTNSPKTLRQNQETDTPGQQHERACIEIEMSENSFDLDLSPPMGHLKYLSPSPPFKGNPGAALDYGSAPVNTRPHSPSEEPDFDPPPSNQEQHLLMLSQSSSPRREELALPPPPNYELYSDASLAREVASYGFKAVKKRTAMIALLNQCWESRNKATLGSRSTQATMSTSSENATTSPSKPKGLGTRTIVAPRSGVEPPAPDTRDSTKLRSAEAAENEVPQFGKRPRGRPRKNSNVETSALAPAQGRRRKLAATSNTQNPGSQVEKPARGRTKKDATALPRKRTSKAKPTASPKQVKSPSKRSTPVPSTPHRRYSPKEVLEIPDSDLDDPFASTPESSPEKQLDLFSSPPAMDLSVTEDTEASLVASPTSQQVSLFQYITKAIVNAPRATDPAEPSWHEKMLMYDPIILEDLTAWLNAGQLDKVGYDGEVSPGDVKKWCESKSVCCLWRVNLRGQERKRF